MRSLWIGALALALLALGGCARGTVQSALGMDKRAPDEFLVVRRAPLIVPPDFDLRPPRPGATQPVNTADDRTLAALTGRPEPTAQALARAATAPSADDQAANDQAANDQA
ncbi:MAG: DUF3035 domain-containing protein, partial [Geminicoccaceae bacterium]